MLAKSIQSLNAFIGHLNVGGAVEGRIGVVGGNFLSIRLDVSILPKINKCIGYLLLQFFRLACFTGHAKSIVSICGCFVFFEFFEYGLGKGFHLSNSYVAKLNKAHHSLLKCDLTYYFQERTVRLFWGCEALWLIFGSEEGAETHSKIRSPCACKPQQRIVWRGQIFVPDPEEMLADLEGGVGHQSFVIQTGGDQVDCNVPLAEQVLRHDGKVVLSEKLTAKLGDKCEDLFFSVDYGGAYGRGLLVAYPLPKLLGRNRSLIESVTDESGGELLEAFFFHAFKGISQSRLLMLGNGIAQENFGFNQLLNCSGIQSDDLNIEFASQSTIILQVIVSLCRNRSVDLLFNITAQRFYMSRCTLGRNDASKLSEAMLLKIKSQSVYLFEAHIQFEWLQGFRAHIAVTEKIQYSQIFFAIHVHPFQTLMLTPASSKGFVWGAHYE